MESLINKLTYFLIFCFIFLTLTFIGGGYYPKPREKISVENWEIKPTFYNKNRPIKILSWNVQGFIGKRYFPIHEKWGTDKKFHPMEIYDNFSRFVDVIKKENPDIIFLQEVAGPSCFNHYQGQDRFIVKKLSKIYPYLIETDYWHHKFLIHPHVFGSIIIKMMILSRFKIEEAERIALPFRIFGNEFLGSFFPGKFCLLKTSLKIEGSNEKIHLYTTHSVSAEFDPVNNQKQLEKIFKELKKQNNNRWIMGGDLNNIPPGFDSFKIYNRDINAYKNLFKLKDYFDNFISAISLQELIGSFSSSYFTYAPNKPMDTLEKDRTLDYIFFSKGLKKLRFYVGDDKYEGISDHLPIITILKYEEIPKN